MQCSIVCDLCGETASVPFRLLPGETPFELVQCGTCGLVYLDPRPDARQLDAFYSGDYYTSRPPTPTDPGTRERFKRLAYPARCKPPGRWQGMERLTMPVARSLVSWRANRPVPPLTGGRLLDVGCGTGEQAAWLRDNLPGWSVEGVEINGHAARMWRSVLGLKVYEGDLTQLGLKPSSYDMISFCHSLEHVFSPRATLREAWCLLRPGGWLGIEVPDIGSREARWAAGRWYHLVVPFHLYHFNAETLSRLVRETGFRVIAQSAVLGNAGATNFARRGRPGVRRRLEQMVAGSAGRLSRWGLRLYAVKD